MRRSIYITTILLALAGLWGGLTPGWAQDADKGSATVTSEQGGPRFGSGRYFKVSLAMRTDDKNGDSYKLSIETFGLKTLPSVPELDRFPQVRNEMAGYVAQGWSYVKLEVEIRDKEQKVLRKTVELFQDDGSARTPKR